MSALATQGDTAALHATSDPAVFRTSRALPAAPDHVYAAFSDAKLLAAWWGPHGFRNEFEEFQFHPGGVWRFVMVAPNGDRFPNENTFTELVPAQRVALQHRCAPHFHLVVELEPMQNGRATRLWWTQVFEDPAIAAAVRHVVEPANEQNLDRLAAVLAPPSCNREPRAVQAERATASAAQP